MKKILFSTLLSVAVMTTLPSLYASGVTSSGAFSVTATIEPCISLTFITDGSGVTLSGSTTGTATLAFGDIQAYGYAGATGVTQALVGSGASATAFTVSSPFDVLVMQANTGSTGYTLTAALNATDANETWSVGGTAVPSTTPVTITAAGTYASATSYALLITIPFTNSTHLAVTNAINFVATAN